MPLPKLPKLSKPPKIKDTSLRRWCIEQALYWPVQGESMGMARADEDVIGRAQKIFDWVSQ